MRRLLIFAIAALGFACKKEKPEPLAAPYPVMHYKDLQNSEVVYFKPKAVDIDDNGNNDFLFGVELVGDPIAKRPIAIPCSFKSGYQPS